MQIEDQAKQLMKGVSAKGCFPDLVPRARWRREVTWCEAIACPSDAICAVVVLKETFIRYYASVGVPSMRTALLVGGLPIAKQLHRLKSGVQVHLVLVYCEWDVVVCRTGVTVFVCFISEGPRCNPGKTERHSGSPR